MAAASDDHEGASGEGGGSGGVDEEPGAAPGVAAADEPDVKTAEDESVAIGSQGQSEDAGSLPRPRSEGEPAAEADSAADSQQQGAAAAEAGPPQEEPSEAAPPAGATPHDSSPSSSRPLSAYRDLRGSRPNSAAIAAQIEGFEADFAVRPFFAWGLSGFSSHAHVDMRFVGFAPSGTAPHIHSQTGRSCARCIWSPRGAPTPAAAPTTSRPPPAPARPSTSCSRARRPRGGALRRRTWRCSGARARRSTRGRGGGRRRRGTRAAWRARMRGTGVWVGVGFVPFGLPI
jgi:hypothetical protein